ncbi:MAG: Lrp/AsnC family transcriptional regulator [Nanoarchaeota archaeon]|nr:Lrp/AsnC family transcriptional regulator [Nanoarchaeota archaeon]
MIPQKDLLILSALRANARLKLTEISKLTKVPISTVFDRMKDYESRLIRGHTTLLDFARLGYTTRAQVLIKTDMRCRDLLREYLSKHQNVNTFCKINNGFDYMVEIIFVTIRQMEDFLESLEQKFTIHNLEIHYIVEDIKKEGFLADPEMVAAT